MSISQLNLANESVSQMVFYETEATWYTDGSKLPSPFFLFAAFWYADVNLLPLWWERPELPILKSLFFVHYFLNKISIKMWNVVRVHWLQHFQVIVYIILASLCNLCLKQAYEFCMIKQSISRDALAEMCGIGAQIRTCATNLGFGCGKRYKIWIRAALFSISLSLSLFFIQLYSPPLS